jgi:hypothetical protein
MVFRSKISHKDLEIFFIILLFYSSSKAHKLIALMFNPFLNVTCDKIPYYNYM